MDYYFETVQRLKFICVDVDDPSGSLDKQDLIGEVEMRLAEIVTSKGSLFTICLSFCLFNCVVY
jgi:hypothetical protein